MSTITVVAIITAKPGKREELLNIARANLAAVRAEEGCIEYGLVIDVDGFGPNQAPMGPDTFAFVEKWTSEDALKLHFTLPHMADYREKSKDLIADRAVHVLKSAD
ncbi:putative quinol monooxygenase [Herbaspirillum robiniae]|uniref:Antibiotic biosynthesis monooxygenase n=1 Tax=Herbaspirillum robiniae TaxID=2014887 RepID=A0A246WW22_9BURK|nr:putative quinol monooxygenase [Herbaspirillum robiniae]NUU00943.1 antibiotic biosynthesis monooxygenase [Herbaspirillum robiniae]OWY31300.1 antibiotic biosynthesis monooxygenase [Herbaspirillum robiniae]